MTFVDPTDMLASLAELSQIPPNEIQWLGEHGEVESHPAGSTIARRGDRIEHLWIVLSGSVTVTRDTGAGHRPVMEWGRGDVTGKLPYSRMKSSSVDIRTEGPIEYLTVHELDFPAMIRRCPTFTALTVHTMLDRARSFNTTELQTEKMVSLGRLAAGLAHELNNPASATVRGAAVLRDELHEVQAACHALFASGISEEGLERLNAVLAAGMERSGARGISALEQADREAEVYDWLSDHGCDSKHAADLAETSITLGSLDELAGELPDKVLDAAIRWLATSWATASVAAEIEGAAKRIHDLVAAVKGFTYMDDLASPDRVDVGGGLRDTVTVLAAKARAKGASVHLDIAPDLPAVRATGGELNQVWMNLIDNALGAIPDSGHIDVGARAEGGRVVVRVVDDGPGIPADVLPRVFEPFFTTKPQGEGTGLGLDISRRLVRRYRGEIDVDSRPGRTEFRVSLIPDQELEGSADGSDPDTSEMQESRSP